MSGHTRRLICICLLGASASLLAGIAVADEPVHTTPISFDEGYPLGVAKFELDHATQMTGWQVADSWYFGRQKGEDSGLTLVWQGGQDQFSFSKEGLRFTRRF